MDKNNLGLTCGYLLATVHLIWALLVWLIPNQLQAFINWIFKLHGLSPYTTIVGMTFVHAVLLLIVTFIMGYILGWLLAWFHNKCKKGKRKR